MRNHKSLLSELLRHLEPEAPNPNGADLARILRRLAACEVEEGGPYRADTGAHPDLGFNLIIALFLRIVGVRLPKLDAFIELELSSPSRSSEVIEDEQLDTLAARFLSAPVRKDEHVTVWSSEELAILTKIRKDMDWRFFSLPEEFSRNARQVVERTIRGNPDKQMSLMPYFMRQALGSQGRRFSDSQLASFGLANVFFWTAFIIYDDFWDEDEAADPKLLPIANLFARHYTNFFSTKGAGTEFLRFFHSLMDKLDAANEWEVLHCRLAKKGNHITLPDTLPEYGDFSIKFYPAAGHVLGPVAMLLDLGYAENSIEFESLMDYFKHYLIAMQLNDDAHDWKEDLFRGHVSTAASVLLKKWQEAHPEQKEIDLEDDLAELERLFWFDTLPELCESILTHTDAAQRALDTLIELGCVIHPAPLQQFIDRNREAALQAQAEQQRSTAFVKTIKSLEETQE